MTYRHAAAALLCALIGGSALGPGSVQAADLVIHGRIGDAFVGIDTRDDWRRHDHRRDGRSHRRGDRRFFPDPFDPDVDEDAFKRRLERRFEYEKLFNGGIGSFPEDRRRRALEGWPPPRKPRWDHRGHRHQRVYPGVLLPERHYYYDDAYRYEDGDRYGDDGDYVREDPGVPSVAPAAEPEPPDARGPRFEAARRPGSVPAVGQRLPQGRPHVALDWRDYDLPEPPPGQTYVRFEGTVLLIEVDTRVVRQVVRPPAG